MVKLWHIAVGGAALLILSRTLKASNSSAPVAAQSTPSGILTTSGQVFDAQTAREAIEAGTIASVPEHTAGYGWFFGIPLQDYVYGATKSNKPLDPAVFQMAPLELINAIRAQAIQGFASNTSAAIVGKYPTIY